jgi:hypothetical protein
MIDLYQEVRDGSEYWARAELEHRCAGHELSHHLKVTVTECGDGRWESHCQLSLPRIGTTDWGSRHDWFEGEYVRPTFATLGKAAEHAAAFWIDGARMIVKDIRHPESRRNGEISPMMHRDLMKIAKRAAGAGR